jgi:hypothetical protein
MATIDLEELYARQIKPLPREDQLRLLAIMEQELARGQESAPRRSIMELHGLGKDIWAGIDAQAYVNELRKEWDDRP